MEFEWSETKRLWVLQERGIDFRLIAGMLFDGRPVQTVSAPHSGEERYLSLVVVEGKIFAVIWMWRGSVVRIITARRARDVEEKRYRSVFG